MKKNVISATAAIVFPFTRRRCYRALTLALAGPSCLTPEMQIEKSKNGQKSGGNIGNEGAE